MLELSIDFISSVSIIYYDIFIIIVFIVIDFKQKILMKGETDN